MNNLWIVVFIGIMLLVLCAARWQAATRALLYIVIFEGAFRKWFFPGLSNQLYLVKDVVFSGALVGMFLSPGAARSRGNLSYLIPVGVFGLFAAGNVLNPEMGSIVGGLFGLKSYVLWAAYPLLLVRLFHTIDDFERYLKHLFYVAIGVCVLAVIQSRAPTDSFLNVYARDADLGIHTYGEEGNVRVTGTFPFLAGYANFLIFICVFLLPVLLNNRPLDKKAFRYVLLPLLVGTSFMTGSRWSVFFIGLFCIAYFGTVVAMGLTKLNVARALLLPICASALIVGVFFENAALGWSQRLVGAEASGDTIYGRTFTPWTDAFSPYIASAFGDGTGSTNNASIAAGEAVGSPVHVSEKPVESEPTRVMAEEGIVGFLFWYGIKLVLIIMMFVLVQRLKQPYMKSIGVAGFWFLVIGVNAPIPFDTTLAAFYWFTIGLIVLLPELDNRAAMQLAGFHPGAKQQGRLTPGLIHVRKRFGQGKPRST